MFHCYIWGRIFPAKNLGKQDLVRAFRLVNIAAFTIYTTIGFSMLTQSDVYL